METIELRKKNTVELEKELSERIENLQKFRFGVNKSKIKNVKEGKNLRKDIARIKTVIKEKSNEK